VAVVVVVVLEDHRSLALRMLIGNIFFKGNLSLSFRTLKDRSVEGGGGGDDDDDGRCCCCCLLRIIDLLHFAFSLGIFSFMGSEVVLCFSHSSWECFVFEE
jgi:uncharacterized membrane protein YgdD (TMEM256/DUF423 family)